MIDREPVDIMGVTAFPNPDKDQRVIRFIDSEYYTLFTIKDGESTILLQSPRFITRYIETNVTVRSRMREIRTSGSVRG